MPDAETNDVTSAVYEEFRPDDCRALMFQGKLGEAEAICLRAIVATPANPEIYVQLGAIQCYQWRVEEAIKSFGTALELAPDHAKARSNLLFTLNYLPACTREMVQAESRLWSQQHESAGTPLYAGQKRDLSRDRRLKVGYVSGDFRGHSVSYFFEPLLKAHERECVEVYCYSDVPQPDAVTCRIEKNTEHWLSVSDWSDDALASRILNDGIDILVDLAGHTGKRNRLTMFALKPAPLQVSWLGYPNTTGLRSIDYRFTDAVADPDGADQWHSEKLVRLPHGFLCYEAPLDAPKVEPPPALKNGFVTFGSFNNLPKINNNVLALWSRLLQRVPRSRIVLKSFFFADAATASRLYSAFAVHGITGDRVTLEPFVPTTRGHLEKYSEIDIALDTFPYNGTTTTCEALWMGVPVVTLRGDHHAGRVGASIMTHAGLSDLIAESIDEYIEKVVNLAADESSLAEMRRKLRSDVSFTSLCDSSQFALSVEAAYRNMWHTFLDSR